MLSQGKIVLTGSSGPVRKDYDRKMSARLRRQNPDTQILLAPGIVKRLIESIDSVRPRSKLVGQCGRGIIFRPGPRARPNHQHHQAQRQKGREPREQKTYRRPEMSSVSHRKVRRQAAPKSLSSNKCGPGMKDLPSSRADLGWPPKQVSTSFSSLLEWVHRACLREFPIQPSDSLW